MTVAEQLVEIREFQAVEVAGLPVPQAADQQRLTRLLAGRLEVLWLANGRCRLTASSWVGVLRLPGVVVRVEPKLPGEQLDLLTMVIVARSRSLALLRPLFRDLPLSSEGSFVDLVVQALCTRVAELLAGGLLQDYRQTSEDLKVLRGRLDVRVQATRHHGQLRVLHCQHELYDGDVLENRIVTAALRVAVQVAESPAVKHEARELLNAFAAAAPGPLPAWSDVQALLDYDRRTEHYRDAHLWSGVLLSGQRLDEPLRSHGPRTSAFMIDMNEIFESFVEQLVKEVIAGTGATVDAQWSDGTILRSQSRPYGRLRPDLLVRRSAGTLAVDAKYKRYDERKIDASDLYQLFVYAQAYAGSGGEVPTSVLLHPASAPGDVRSIELAPGGAPLARVLQLGLCLPPLLQELRRTRTVLPAVRARLRAVLGLEGQTA